MTIRSRNLFLAALASLTLVGGAVAYHRMAPAHDGKREFHMACSLAPNGIFPARTSVENSCLINIICEASYGYNGEGKLVPVLAATPPIMSNDGKEMTIKLRTGRRFSSNGRECIASDHLFMFKLLADAHAGMGMSIENVESLEIRGYKEWHEASKASETTDYSRPIPGVQVVDDYTLKFTFDTPQTAVKVMEILALDGHVIPHELWEKHGKKAGSYIEGTGPYKLAKLPYHTNSAAHLFDRNPHYKGTAPVADRIVVHIVPETSVALKLLTQGKLHYLQLEADGYAAVTDAAGKLKPAYQEQGLTLLESAVMDHVKYIAMHLADPVSPLHDKRVRQAIALGFDQQDFLKASKGMKPAYSILPPGMEGYDPHHPGGLASQYDPERARALIVAWQQAMQQGVQDAHKRCQQATSLLQQAQQRAQVSSQALQRAEKKSQEATKRYQKAYEEALKAEATLQQHTQRDSKGIQKAQKKSQEKEEVRVKVGKVSEKAKKMLQKAEQHAQASTKVLQEAQKWLLLAQARAKAAQHPTLTLDYYTEDITLRQMAEHFQRDMEGIGINIVLVGIPRARFVKKIMEANSGLQLTLMREVGDTSLSYGFFKMFEGKNVPPEAYNIAGYDNPTFNKLAHQAVNEPNKRKRIALYKKLNQLVINDLPCLPLGHPGIYCLVGPHVRDVVARPLYAAVRMPLYVSFVEEEESKEEEQQAHPATKQ